MYGTLGIWTNRIRSIPDHTGLLGGDGGPGSSRGKTDKNGEKAKRGIIEKFENGSLEYLVIWPIYFIF